MTEEAARVEVSISERKQRPVELEGLRSGAVRVAPLVLRTRDGLTSAGEAGFGLVVGEVLVVADDTGVRYRVWLGHTWSMDPDRIGDEQVDVPDDAHRELLEQLRTMVAEVLPRRRDGEDHQYAAARHAKAIAEMSRNSATVLRERRYYLESELAGESNDDASERHTQIVAGILKLHIVCGRVMDLAEDLIREGLYLWVGDGAAYSAYRRLRDPDLLVDVAPANETTRPWMRLHDTGIRQCQALGDAASRESAALGSLLIAASSTAGSREAEAQTRLNQLVGLLSIGLGVPALVLTLYGAQVLLPLETGRQWVAFLPVGVSLLVAALLAIFKAPEGRTRHLWRIAGVCVIVILAALIVGAIVIVPSAAGVVP